MAFWAGYSAQNLQALFVLCDIDFSIRYRFFSPAQKCPATLGKEQYTPNLMCQIRTFDAMASQSLVFLASIVFVDHRIYHNL